GKVRQAPGLPAKPLASANCRIPAGRAAAMVSHVDLVAKVMGTAGVVGALSNGDGMRGSYDARRNGCADRQTSQSFGAPAIASHAPVLPAKRPAVLGWAQSSISGRECSYGRRVGFPCVYRACDRSGVGLRRDASLDFRAG